MYRPIQLLLFSALLPFHGTAQDHVTPDQYGFTVDTDLVYGHATNYLGLVDTLRLDLYKPTGNSDTRRPLLVIVHGGTWLAGCKDDPSGIVPMVLQFVKRGYVVASVNYRLGWHKAGFVSGAVAGYGLSPWPASYRAFYALDSAEMKRAMYRGMQDVKGAIRWMKARADQDSVCIDKVFVGGESAGAFVALAAAFLDDVNERPAACGALPDAPMPYEEVANITGFECQEHVYNVSPEMLARPDLGPVDGDLNMNGFDARVKGAASFYGGVPWDALALDWWQGPDTPAVYLYHQTCDGIVHFDHGRPMSIISANCNLGAAPWHYNYPDLYGNGAIAAAFSTMVSPPLYTTDFEDCAPFDINLPFLECPRYGNNGSYHFTDDAPLRAAHLATFFAPFADAPGACLNTSVAASSFSTMLTIQPQPASDRIHINCALPMRSASVFDLNGRIVFTADRAISSLDVQDLPNGLYTLTVNTTDGPVHGRFLIAR